jgi:hypothetical protein
MKNLEVCKLNLKFVTQGYFVKQQKQKNNGKQKMD